MGFFKCVMVNHILNKINIFFKRFIALEERLTLATLCTLFRLVLAPLIFCLILNKYWILSIILFLIAAFSDFLDGFLARKRNELTNLGKYLDPIVDKIFMILVFFAFAYNSYFFQVPHWFAFFIVIREALMVFGATYLCFYKKILDVKPTIWGKLTTFCYYFLQGF